MEDHMNFTKNTADNESVFSLAWLENGFAFRPNLENLSHLKNLIIGVLDLFVVLAC